jgi:ferritin-like metal-binding protein YciE
MNRKQLEELLYQALETEKGGVLVYTTALSCVKNADLKKEWQKYLKQTKHHVEIVEGVFETFGLDPAKETPGRKIVRGKAESLLAAMETARKQAPDAAELVAAECVVDAETKDHQNWELLGESAKTQKGEEKTALTKACEAVEEEEDEHLYHTAGWCRELWMTSLGLPAVLPPPEERKDVKTELEAAKAKGARTKMLESEKPAKKKIA